MNDLSSTPCPALSTTALLFSLLLSPPVLAAQNPHTIPDGARVMDELVTAHAFGAPGTMTSSPDGAYTYAAEGGAIALIHSDPDLPNAEENYETPLWRVQVGKLGVLPIEIALDPDMSWQEPLSAADPAAYLLIAAGRDGLWIMDASPLAPPTGEDAPKAYRVDDTGNPGIAKQDGRKWCNDVKILRFQEKTYVLALFAGSGRSNLRVYNLDQVREVATHGTETGHEILPTHTFFLKSNPNVVAPPGNPNAEAFAFGMAVDMVGPSEANIYVAMGEHGIFRAKLSGMGGGLQAAPTIVHGPWFGDGSAYVQHGLDGSGRGLYGSLRYYLPVQSTNPANLVARYNPYFLDVAVQNDGPGAHRLYAAVDHLGWCAFSLDDDVPWDEDIYNNSPGGSPGFPDFIQEGKRFPIGPQSNDEIHLYDKQPSSPKMSHTRHLEVVRTQDAQTQEVFSSLVVTLSPRRFVTDPGHMNEGRVLGPHLNLGAVPLDSIPATSKGNAEFLLAYDLRNVGDVNGEPPWLRNTQNLVGAIEGGWDLHVPETQPPGELHVIYGANASDDRVYEPFSSGSGKHNLVRAWFDPWPPVVNTPVDHSGFLTRGRHFRLGREVICVGPSKLNGRVLVSSTNDAGVIPDGPLVFDPGGEAIEAPYATHGFQLAPIDGVSSPPGVAIPAGQNANLTYGVTMDPRGGFVGSHAGKNHEYRMGTHTRDMRFDGETESLFPVTWLASKFTFSGPVQAPSVHVDKNLYLIPPPNKFSLWPFEATPLEGRAIWSGRAYYCGMSTFDDYNEYVAENFGSSVDPQGILFAGINGSPQGIWAIGHSRLQAALDHPSTPTNNQLLVPTDYSSPGGAAPGLFLGALVTHPEYWNIDDTRTGDADEDAENFLAKSTTHGLAQVEVWYPDLFEMPVDSTPQSTTGWVLAVPCGYVALDVQDPLLIEHPSWKPDDPQLVNGKDRMLVRLFDVSDPTAISTVPETTAAGPNLDSANLPAMSIVGPAGVGSAILVRALRVKDQTGTVRQLLVVGDLAGRVYVYDIANVLQTMRTQSPPKGTHFGSFFTGDPLVTYDTQRSLSDSAPGGVYGLEVANESWTSGGETMEASYVYIGTPRVGVEVLEARFNASNVLELQYLGRIQTPGNASFLHKQTVENTEYLFVADYDGGIRIYKHP